MDGRAAKSILCFPNCGPATSRPQEPFRTTSWPTAPASRKTAKPGSITNFSNFSRPGISLTGPEVKSLRAGQVSFGDSFVESSDGEAWLVGMRIAPYDKAGYARQDPDRRRRLLLHAREIHLITTKVEQKGLTVVPVKLYFRHGKIKVEIALARGRKLHDQREELKRRAEARDTERELARR